jgi:anthranilate phosphoribosyltransferase
MKYVAPVRRELGVRTLFNILGPLTNPAHAPNQVMGVFHPDLVGIQCRVLKQLGSRHVLIVHGRDGLDEISLCAPTLIAELKNGEIEQYEFHPQSLGFELCSAHDLRADSAEQSKAMLLAVLDNQAGPARDIVLLNAAAALYVSGVATSLADGVARARDVLASGAAKQRLQALVDLSQSLAPRPA